MGHLPVRRTPQPGRLPGMRPPQPPATNPYSELYYCMYRARSLCHRRHHDARHRRPPARVHPPTANSESALRHAVKIRRHPCVGCITAPPKNPSSGHSITCVPPRMTPPREERHQSAAVIRSSDLGFPPEVAESGLELLHGDAFKKGTTQIA